MEAATQQLAAEVVDAINDVSGRHPARAAHAKGVLCAGTFTPAPDAAKLSRAAHFGGDPVRTHVRFSNGGGDPGSPDGAPEGRGMAVKFYLPDGSTTDIVSISLPVFLVRTPADFLELMRARRPDPDTGQPDMEKLGAFFGAHPEALPAIQHVIGSPPTASYLTCAYNSLHAFGLVDDAGATTWVRYRWEPEGGEATVPADEVEGLAPDYLQRDLEERLGRGPTAFTLSVTIAEDGDPLEDPTAAWPDERRRVEMGRLEVTGLAFDREQDGDVLVFDPTRVTDGVECSGDPILNFRSHAYAESVLRRTGVARTSPAG
jgi:catalase